MTLPSNPYLADKSIPSLATEFIDIFRRTSYEKHPSQAVLIYGILRFNQYLVDACELLGTLTPALLHTSRQYHLTRSRASALTGAYAKTSGLPFRNGKKRRVPGQRLRNETVLLSSPADAGTEKALCTIILHTKSVQRETVYRYNQLHRRNLNEERKALLYEEKIWAANQAVKILGKSPQRLTGVWKREVTFAVVVHLKSPYTNIHISVYREPENSDLRTRNRLSHRPWITSLSHPTGL
ncbi:uncharacterized protein EV420DRAFT_1570331 [Desarmillaria tabescens]|uniref:Uncharacterized protein n=1 Tax=Armillaria tabescens TaxID=1929756 RepID=A0AA39JPZ7_ARMTA|nr:uncharacterized protein EV420DRAFT_1570331 [Desarmillaria tabescens]KAK0446609.1 hypothetical protein EV420DRAFT_1570331 [Desarmillaria tabescens]